MNGSSCRGGGLSEPVDPELTESNGTGGQVTVKADVSPGRGPLAWEAGGHQKLDMEELPLSKPTLSPRCSYAGVSGSR